MDYFRRTQAKHIGPGGINCHAVEILRQMSSIVDMLEEKTNRILQQ